MAVEMLKQLEILSADFQSSSGFWLKLCESVFIVVELTDYFAMLNVGFQLNGRLLAGIRLE